MRHVSDNSVRQVSYIEELVMSRVVASTLIAAVVAMFTVAGVARAAEKIHNGKLISVMEAKDVKVGKTIMKEGKLVMTDIDGKKEHTHAILAKTKITLNKNGAKLSDLKKGDLISVTTDSAGKVMAVAATRDAK
jgi:hypothetical protein